MNDPRPHQVAGGWDRYWQGAGDGGNRAGGVQLPQAATFWQQVFTGLAGGREPARVLDLGCGDGAVIGHAQAALSPGSTYFVCADASAAAVREVTRKFPQARGVVADAAHSPFRAASFDAVTSQFGVEYAGVDAITRAAGLVRPGGVLALLLHHAGGGIYRESAAGLEAVRGMMDSRFLELARRFFEAGFVACQGGSRDAYDAAGRALQPAVRRLESIMDRHGPHVAGDTLLDTYEGVARIHREIQQHEPRKVLAWLSSIEAELPAHAARFESMMDAALDAGQFASVVGSIAALGYSIRRSGPLPAGPESLPAGWVLVAVRDAVG